MIQNEYTTINIQEATANYSVYRYGTHLHKRFMTTAQHASPLKKKQENYFDHVKVT